jgi:O-antigen ligase
VTLQALAPAGRREGRRQHGGTLFGRPGPYLVTPRNPPPFDRLAVGVVAAAISLSALVNPKLPGHSGPVDFVIVAAVFVVLLWALRSRVTVQVPYAIPVALLMATGLLAGLFSGVHAVEGLTAVVQEIFLLLWSAAIATVCRSLWALRVLLRAWAVSATAWAALLLVAVTAHIGAISGTANRVATGTGALRGSSGSGFRARLFFDHPNMAGNFFMIAVFIVVASGYPRRLWLRVPALLVLLGAMIVTGSNAALFSLVGGVVVTLFLQVRARSGMVSAVAFLTAATVIIGVVGLTGVEPLVSTAQQSDTSLLKDTVGRSARSATARQSLFEWQFKLYERGKLVGIGPNGTQDALGASAAPAVKEAHNDYLGTLVERGPLGLLAVFGLMAAVLTRCVSFTRRPPPRRLAAVVPVPGAIVGACAAFAFTAFTHEILHYRWLYTLLGVVAAVYLLERRESALDSGDAGRVLPSRARGVASGG